MGQMCFSDSIKSPPNLIPSHHQHPYLWNSLPSGHPIPLLALTFRTRKAMIEGDQTKKWGSCHAEQVTALSRRLVQTPHTKEIARPRGLSFRDQIKSGKTNTPRTDTSLSRNRATEAGQHSCHPHRRGMSDSGSRQGISIYQPDPSADDSRQRDPRATRRTIQ